MNIVQCTNVTKAFGQSKALNNLSFEIEENKITGLIGRNGAGKTTLLKIISGFIKQTSGEIQVFSEQPFNSLFVSANSIFIDDHMSLPPTLNLEEILTVAANFYEHWDQELANRLVDYFVFDRKQHHDNLSKGKKHTFNMILGLSSRCALTIFDEPATGMDAAVRKDFYRALLKDYLIYPRTIIISTHYLDEIEDLLEDVLLIHAGEKYFHIPMIDLKEWAIGVRGKTADVMEWIKDKEVIHQQSISIDSQYAVLRNKDIPSNLPAGMTVSAVRPSDVCVYLTNNTKGGIDDVFN
ncbi:ABC transporter ATP-binding protein [Bacillus sp. FJAT-52991]|uniref:ABC transporter ATP-binding protein n=1 Tax=Bacillus kandeliae TaxID=3129297 RepID=A0ABZ2N8S8_9BACI